jgi:uncharacterized protein YdgA (DUF945 family)
MSAKRISLVEIIIWLFVFLLLVLVISPFGLGFKIKDDYSALTEKMSNMMQMDISIAKYDRGFFSSDVILEMQLPGLPTAIQFKENIIHGPIYLGLINQGKSPFIAAVVKGELLPAAGFEAMVEQAFSGRPAIIYQNLIDFSGNVDTEGYMPAVDTVIEREIGPLVIKSSGMLMSSHFSAIDETISGENKLSKFVLNSEEANVNLNNLNISFSGKIGENNLLMGDSVLSMDKLDVQSNNDQFALSNFSVSSVSTEVGALVNTQLRMNAQEVLLSNQKLGPIIFALSINGLNAISINQLTEMQKGMEEKIKQGIPAEQVNAMLVGEMMGVIPELFKQAVITIDPLSVQSELGKLEASLDFSVDGLDQNTPADPMFLLNAISLELDMGVDEALLKQLVEWQLTANQSQITATGNELARKAEADVPMDQKVSENLKGLVDENWLVFADEKYSSHIKLHQGLMTMNDKQVDPMAQIMSQMGGAPAPAPAETATP